MTDSAVATVMRVPMRTPRSVPRCPEELAGATRRAPRQRPRVRAASRRPSTQRPPPAAKPRRCRADLPGNPGPSTDPSAACRRSPRGWSAVRRSVRPGATGGCLGVAAALDRTGRPGQPASLAIRLAAFSAFSAAFSAFSAAFSTLLRRPRWRPPSPRPPSVDSRSSRRFSRIRRRPPPMISAMSVS